MVVLLQIVLYCFLFMLLVKCAARNSGRNCLYFYPDEYLAEAQKRGLADIEETKKKAKGFMIPFCIIMFIVLILLLRYGIMSQIIRQHIFRQHFSL